MNARSNSLRFLPQQLPTPDDSSNIGLLPMSYFSMRDRQALADSSFNELAFCTGPALWRWRKFALFPRGRGGENIQDRLL
ncbi:hypothetical protein [Sphingobacterium pedocola]|uniref:hypothetical protein n=1 Tax=Sphingobacterium pedocola TaxID=2082722 RepID=UPI0018C995FA|nr:hypothetical protein [Sphingobacterium pedocola]